MRTCPTPCAWSVGQPLVERDGFKAPRPSSCGLGVHGKMGIPEGALLPFGILLLGLPALRCFSLGVHFFLRKKGFLFLLSVSPSRFLRWVSYTNLLRESSGTVVAGSDEIAARWRLIYGFVRVALSAGLIAL